MTSNLRRLEPGRLVEDDVRDAELAQVVEQARPADVDDGRRPAGRIAGASPSAIVGDPLRVRSGERALRIDDVGERAGDPVDVVVVGRRNAPPGSSAIVRPTRSGAARSSSRPRVAGVEQRVGDVRVVPRARAVRRGLACRRSRPRRRDEDVEALAGGQDPRQGMDRRRRGGRAARRRRPSARGGRGSRPPTGSSKPALRAIAAPRSQRSCSISRCSRRPFRPIAMSRRSRSGSGSVVGQRADRERGVGEDRALGRRLAGLERDVVGAEDPGDRPPRSTSSRRP